MSAEIRVLRPQPVDERPYWVCARCESAFFRLYQNSVVACANCMDTISSIAVVDRDLAPGAEVLALRPEPTSPG